ncbi:hypothetical protein MMC11_002437 [Xylographa trunciseda]|nr:hypothetical protein [Xylographa trunciseda]
MSTDRAGRVIFIGNIPYGLTEEQIIQIFSSVGQVLSFRLVYDNDTGKPKGFGFAEFADTDAAASAVRNMDKYQIMGRELRVDFSHVGGKDDAAPAGYQPQPQQPPNGYAPPPPPAANGLGPLPPGVDLPPKLTCPDAISQTLSTLPPPQLLDILSQMKGLVMGDPNKATELLKQAPQLSYAIFQALLLMGLVDTSVLASVVEQAAQPVPPPVPTPLQQIPARPVPPYQPPPPQQQYQPPPQQTPYPAYPQIPGQGHVNTPPIHQQPYAPPPPIQQPPQPPSQEDLLRQVLDMPQYDVDKLPPAERQQIMALKQQFGGRIGY